MRTYSTPDWIWWEAYQEQHKARDENNTPLPFGTAYTQLLQLHDEHKINKTISARSNKWLNQELTEQVTRTRRTQGEEHKENSKKLRKMVKSKNRKHWEKFLEEQGSRHPWDIVRIAKDPFKCTPTMGDLTDTDGNLLRTDKEKVGAFQKHNLVTLPQTQPSHPATNTPQHTF